MLDLDPGRDYVPPSTDTPVPGAGWRQDPAADGRAAAGSPEAGSTALRRPGRRENFPAGPEARAFRRRCFPDASAADWNDWRWQARHRLRTLADLERAFRLSDDEREATRRHQGSLPVGITPYYAALHEPRTTRPSRCAAPTSRPATSTCARPARPTTRWARTATRRCPASSTATPTACSSSSTGFCSTYCRYCTRSRMVGEAGGEYHFSVSQWEKALDYIEAHPEIRDVLLSGGDPLTLGDDKLDWLLGRLRRIPHVEFLRIGTKVPVVLPQRITRALAKVLRKHQPWLSLHLTHPRELTPEATEACARLADAGMPARLADRAAQGRQRRRRHAQGPVPRPARRAGSSPTTSIQCDPITGSAHFRTPVEKGLEIIRSLRGHTTGYAVPHFVIDVPGGGGKVPLLPEYLVGREGDELVFRNFEGRLFRYHDPVSPAVAREAA